MDNTEPYTTPNDNASSPWQNDPTPPAAEDITVILDLEDEKREELLDMMRAESHSIVHCFASVSQGSRCTATLPESENLVKVMRKLATGCNRAHFRTNLIILRFCGFCDLHLNQRFSDRRQGSSAAEPHLVLLNELSEFLGREVDLTTQVNLANNQLSPTDTSKSKP